MGNPSGAKGLIAISQEFSKMVLILASKCSFFFYMLTKARSCLSFSDEILVELGHFQKYHNTLCLSKQYLCKILEGQTKSIMVFLKVAYLQQL